MLGWVIERTLGRFGIRAKIGDASLRSGMVSGKKTLRITLHGVTIISRHVSHATLKLEKIEADVHVSWANRYLQVTGLLPMRQAFAVYGQKTKCGFDALVELEGFSIDNFKAVFHDHLMSTFIKDISSDTLFDIKASYQHDNSVRFPKLYTRLHNTAPVAIQPSRMAIDRQYLVRELVSRNHLSSQYVTFDRIPELVKVAVVSTEDPTFWLHKGFSEITLGMALRNDINNRKLSMGGSSISQQLVKNALLTTHRTLYRKAEEMILTLLMENYYHTSKADILEVYLNMIELAPSVYGIHDGSLYYFGKRCEDLDIEDVLTLTYIIPRPMTFERQWKDNHPDLKVKLREHINMFAPTVIRKLGNS